MSKVHKTEPTTPPRGLARRHGFLEALSRMPYFETWTEEINPSPRILTPHEATSMYEAGMLAVTDVVSDNAAAARFVSHVRLIPRRVRRDMAKKLAKRGFQAMRGL